MQVGDADQLRGALERLLADEPLRRRMGRRAREVILRRQGATAGNYELLATHLQALTERRASPPPALWSLAVYFLLPYAMFNLVRRGLRYPRIGPAGRNDSATAHPLKVPGTSGSRRLVGEVRSAAQLVHELGRRFADYRLMVTTATPTGSDQVRELFADRVSHSYVPWDLPGAVGRFMDRVKPEFAIVAETEFWPNLFGECGKRGIPLFLVNVNISPDSLWRYKRVPVATNAMLANADLLCAQTRRDARQLEDLGVSRHLIHVTGNLKSTRRWRNRCWPKARNCVGNGTRSFRADRREHPPGRRAAHSCVIRQAEGDLPGYPAGPGSAASGALHRRRQALPASGPHRCAPYRARRKIGVGCGRRGR